MSFAVGLGFSAVGYSLCAAFFLHGKKNGIYCIFSTIFLTVGYYLLNSFLSLSLAKEKSGFVVKTKG